MNRMKAFVVQFAHSMWKIIKALVYTVHVRSRSVSVYKYDEEQKW